MKRGSVTIGTICRLSAMRLALIAAVRRFLVITAGTSPIAGRDSLVELGLLLLFMVASACALYLVRPRQS